MEKLTPETRRIMNERFGKDALMALATVSGGEPFVRTVDAYWEDGSFYVVTHALSGKMRQIAEHPSVALCGEWFTARGEGVNLGPFARPENAAIASKLRQVFLWLSNGHTPPEDETTVILQIRLTDGVLMANGNRFEIDFRA